MTTASIKPPPPIDLTPGLPPLQHAAEAVEKQAAWISWCRQNGHSYTGENGRAIEEADRRELEIRKARLRGLVAFICDPVAGI